MSCQHKIKVKKAALESAPWRWWNCIKVNHIMIASIKVSKTITSRTLVLTAFIITSTFTSRIPWKENSLRILFGAAGIILEKSESLQLENWNLHSFKKFIFLTGQSWKEPVWNIPRTKKNQPDWKRIIDDFRNNGECLQKSFKRKTSSYKNDPF